jgi:hypothetical protein
VPVMDIRGVGMFMIQRFMDMGMRMVPKVFSIMDMPVVFIGVMMTVLMFDRDMMMSMSMSLGRKNQGPGQHQTECNHYKQVRKILKYYP